MSNISTDQMLYTEADLEAAMDKIETINFHEEKEVGGIKFWCYNAGHVLGAAMFMIEIAGVKILYTGDFRYQPIRDQYWYVVLIFNQSQSRGGQTLDVSRDPHHQT